MIYSTLFQHMSMRLAVKVTVATELLAGSFIKEECCWYHSRGATPMLLFKILDATSEPAL